MSKSLIEFYKDVLSSLGFPSNNDGYILVGENDDKMPITVDGKPLVLPLKTHVSSLLETDDNGEIVATKVLYNPLKESAIKGNSLSLVKTKTFVEGRLSYSIAMAGYLLLVLANKQELQKKVSFEVSKFLGAIHGIKNMNIKELVDDKSIQTWLNLYNNAMDNGLGYIKIYLKKSGKENGVKYNRLAVLSSPVYSDLIKADTNTPVMGIKLRNKDLKVFKILFEYLLEGIAEDPNTVTIGSNDLESPAFISLMELYIKLITKINTVVEELSNIDKEKAESAYTLLSISTDELKGLAKYATEVNIIPSENEIEMNKNTVSTQDIQNKANVYVQNSTIPTKPVVNTGYDKPLPIGSEPESSDPIDRILAKRGLNNNLLPQQQQVMLNPNAYNNGYVNVPQAQPQPYPNMVYQQPLTGVNRPQPQLTGLPPLPNGMGYNINNMAPMYNYPGEMGNYYQNNYTPQPVPQRPLTGVARY